MKLEEQRQAWNSRARAAMLSTGVVKLPPAVLAHALRARWIPRTSRAAMDGYWRAHPIRAERLARGLALRSGTPPGWRWRNEADAPAVDFRTPPLAYRLAAEKRVPGQCVVCGQPVFRLGWHTDPWNSGIPNRRAAWHACCVVAWKFWTAPSQHRKVLSALQGRRCALSGRRLLRTAEVDHRVPLYEVWRDHRDLRWPALLAFWGTPNLQVVNRLSHVEKSLDETRDRARLRLTLAVPPDSRGGVA